MSIGPSGDPAPFPFVLPVIDAHLLEPAGRAQLLKSHHVHPFTISIFFYFQEHGINVPRWLDKINVAIIGARVAPSTGKAGWRLPLSLALLAG